MLTRRLFSASIGDEVALAEEAKARLAEFGPAIPSGATINALAGNLDANLASSVLHQALLREPHYGDFIRQVDRSPEAAVKVPGAPLLIIVPGMFYRDYPEIGADGGLVAGIAEKFGFEVVTAPTLSLGSVAENLEILHAFLNRVATREFWLASLSRGSAEIKWLVQRHPDAPYLADLRAWISICGIISGTPLHERIYANPILGTLHRGLARINRINPALGEELLRSSDHWGPARLPSDTKMVNVIAIPLSWHVTNSAIRRYHRICHLGPTDGVVLLADYLNEPGYIYPVWGADHFLRSPHIARLFYRLLSFLLVRNGESDEKPETRASCRDIGAVHSRRNGTGSQSG